MSPARIIDIRGILHHVEWRFSERRSLSGGRLSSPSPEVPGRRSPKPPGATATDGPGTALAGQVVVFTGKLSSLGRREAAALVIRLGGDTADDVNARTTMLVVGAEGFEGSGRAAIQASNKLKRAEELKAGGAPVRIVPEDEFCRLVGVPTAQTLRQQYHSTRDLLARYRLLRDDHLRYLVKCGVIRPVVRTNCRHLFRVRGSGDHQAGQRRACGQRIIPRDRPEPDGLPARSAGVRLPSRRGPRQDSDASTSRGSDTGAAPAREVDGERDTRLAEEYFRAGSALDDGDESKSGAGRRRLSQSARMRSRTSCRR